MKHPIQVVTTAFCGLLLCATAFNAQADSYEDGLMAYTVGNYTEAGQYLMDAAEKGNTGAEHMLMRLFSESKLFSKNLDQETLKWVRKAAEKGIMQAQFVLAEIYANKQGNFKAAIELYQQAANQGHPEAYYKLGEIFENGAKDVNTDSTESTRMYQIAASEFDVFAQKGHAKYQFTLASMYQHAKGVEKDMTLALKWMGKSALQGHALAQLALGHLYAQGEDVSRDTRRAKYWLDMAAAQGVSEAIAKLDELKLGENTKLAAYVR